MVTEAEKRPRRNGMQRTRIRTEYIDTVPMLVSLYGTWPLKMI
ncbi:MAG: hypothetical protein ACLSH6_07320 [Limosilactobacillus pontis]